MNWANAVPLNVSSSVSSSSFGYNDHLLVVSIDRKVNSLGIISMYIYIYVRVNRVKMKYSYGGKEVWQIAWVNGLVTINWCACWEKVALLKYISVSMFIFIHKQRLRFCTHN
jgi:hypothetical protein